MRLFAMTRKSFKVSNIGVDKTRTNRNNRGKVVAVGVGEKGDLTRMTWSSGKEGEVSSCAINKPSSPDTDSPSGRDIDGIVDEVDLISADGDEEGSFMNGEVSIHDK